MNNIKTNLNKLVKFIAARGTFLAYQAWYEIIQNRPLAAQQQQTLTEVKDSVNEINEKLNKIVDDNLKNKLLEQNKLLEND
jgi:L-cysteine desulfidase